MTIQNNRRVYKPRGSNFIDISPFIDDGDCGYVVECGFKCGNSIDGRRLGLESVVRHVSSYFDDPHLSIIINRTPWNAKNPIAQKRGAWHGLSLKVDGWLDDKRSMIMEFEDEIYFIGVASIVNVDYSLIIDAFDGYNAVLNICKSEVDMNRLAALSGRCALSRSKIPMSISSRLNESVTIWSPPNFGDIDCDVFTVSNKDIAEYVSRI